MGLGRTGWARRRGYPGRPTHLPTPPPFPSSTHGPSLLIFGGFADFCEDYCNDVWRFDLSSRSWTELIPHNASAVAGPGKYVRAIHLLPGPACRAELRRPALQAVAVTREWRP